MHLQRSYERAVRRPRRSSAPKAKPALVIGTKIVKHQDKKVRPPGR
jgi:hypothetical protein